MVIRNQAERSGFCVLVPGPGSLEEHRFVVANFAQEVEIGQSARLGVRLGQLRHFVVVPGHPVGEWLARVLVEEHVKDRRLFPEGSFDPESANLNIIQTGEIGKRLLDVG